MKSALILLIVLISSSIIISKNLKENNKLAPLTETEVEDQPLIEEEENVDANENSNFTEEETDSNELVENESETNIDEENTNTNSDLTEESVQRSCSSCNRLKETAIYDSCRSKYC